MFFLSFSSLNYSYIFYTSQATRRLGTVILHCISSQHYFKHVSRNNLYFHEYIIVFQYNTATLYAVKIIFKHGVRASRDLLTSTHDNAGCHSFPTHQLREHSVLSLDRFCTLMYILTCTNLNFVIHYLNCLFVINTKMNVML